MKKESLLVFGLLFLIITAAFIPVFDDDSDIKESETKVMNEISTDISIQNEENGTIYVIVNSTIFDDLKAKLNQYKIDIESSGRDVNITKNTYDEPDSLREFLKERYQNGNLVGVFFVGDLPYARYEMNNDEHGYSNFPIDLYYMDLDGEWNDTDGNGIYDTHRDGEGDVQPEVWVGRINMKTQWADEIDLYKNYFDKIHNYRTGKLSSSSKALLYLDDDWVDWTDYAKDSIDNLYKNVEVVNKNNLTTADDYQSRLEEGYEWIHIHSHSNSSSLKHAFQIEGGEPGSGGNFTSEELFNNGQRSLFANIFTNKSANYTVPNYLSGWYALTDDYGLANIGSTKDGGMIDYKEFYDSLSNGNNMGEAFKDWWAQNGESDRKWTYGLTLIGDPALNPTSMSNKNLTKHEPIRINDDEEFNQTAAEEGWSGSGVKNDPYMIKNYKINAETYSSGIYIGNTTSYFRIEDCYIYDALNLRKQSGVGIRIHNVNNGFIINNTLSENYKEGIKITDSSYIDINENSVKNNYHNGISILNSSYLIVQSNTFSQNKNDGSLLENTNNIEFLDNIMDKNKNDGMYIKQSKNNIMHKNSINNNSLNGINIEDSNSTGTEDNSITNNTNSGIFVKKSHNNFIKNNTIRFNDLGLKNYDCVGNQLLSNKIHFNGRGIILEKSREINLNGNEMKENYLEILYGNKNSWNSHEISESNTIDGKPILYLKNQNNIDINDDYSQIILANCSDVNLKQKEILDMYGIAIGHSDGVNIKNNTIKGLKTSLRLISTSNTNILNNHFIENKRAIVLFNSKDNTIFNNKVESSNNDGIHIVSSYNNIIANNTIKDNKIDGLELSNSLANLIRNNLFISNGDYGVRINDQSRLNRVYDNTFLWNNGAGLTYNSKHVQAYGNGDNYWNSSDVGNYWRDWTSPDSDNDARVDQPYDINGDGDAKDYYPMTKSPIPLIPEVKDFNLELKSGVARLSWNPSSEKTYLGIDQYWIYRENSSGMTYFVGNVSSDTHTFNDTSLDEEGTYTYYVRVVNITENEVEGSPPSQKLSIEYTPKESQEIPLYYITAAIGIIGIAIVGILLYRKIENNKKEN
ncbi:MAG: right-handed parallel beta-helix repeat-containing protein [Thermoplasmatota archaeon]